MLQPGRWVPGTDVWWGHVGTLRTLADTEGTSSRQETHDVECNTIPNAPRMRKLAWKVLTLTLMAGCVGPQGSEEEPRSDPGSDLSRGNQTVVPSLPEEEWKDPDVWLVLDEEAATDVPEGGDYLAAVGELAKPLRTHWGLDPSTLELGQLPEDFFDSLAVATRGASPDDWFPGPVFPFGSGTIQQHADTLTGWFVLVLRDNEGKPYKWPIYRPYLQLVAVSEDGKAFFAVQKGGDQGWRVSKLRAGLERR